MKKPLLTNRTRQIAKCAVGTMVLLSVACDRAVDAPAAPTIPRLDAAANSPTLFATSASAQSQRPEWASERLARLIPSFGGAIVEPSAKRLVVYLTDLSSAPIAKSLVESDVRAYGRPELSVTFRQGRYAFTQLEKWQSSLLLGPSAGVVLAEIDERNNRLRIGITRESARGGQQCSWWLRASTCRPTQSRSMSYPSLCHS